MTSMKMAAALPQKVKVNGMRRIRGAIQKILQT
jgi:hypothetical protein